MNVKVSSSIDAVHPFYKEANLTTTLVGAIFFFYCMLQLYICFPVGCVGTAERAEIVVLLCPLPE